MHTNKENKENNLFFLAPINAQQIDHETKIHFLVYELTIIRHSFHYFVYHLYIEYTTRTQNDTKFFYYKNPDEASKRCDLQRPSVVMKDIFQSLIFSPTHRVILYPILSIFIFVVFFFISSRQSSTHTPYKTHIHLHSHLHTRLGPLAQTCYNT